MDYNTNAGSWKILRILVGVGSAIPALFAFLLIRTNIDQPFSWAGVSFVSFPITIATLGWWFALFGHRATHRSWIMWALTGGVALGVIGFIGGFVGPLIFAPEANQGPLLGIIITGPLGFLAGFWLGAFYGFFRVRRSSPE